MKQVSDRYLDWGNRSLGESAEVGAKIKTNFDFGTILSRGSEERTLLSHSKSLPESH